MRRLFAVLVISLSAVYAQGHARMIYPVGGESWQQGDTVVIEWANQIVHDPLNWDVLLSMDNGTTFDTIAANLHTDTFRLTWVVPDVLTDQLVIRVIQDNATGDYSTQSQAVTVAAIGTRIPEDLDRLTVTIFPNPTQSQANIYVPASWQGWTIANSVGQTIATSNSMYTTDSGPLPSGLYFVRPKALGNGTAKKLIVR